MARAKNTPLIPILLIEDNPIRIQWFQNYLPIGFRLVAVRNGGSALGMLKRDRGHVLGGILLDHDLQMGVVTVADRDLSGTQMVEAMIGNISNRVPVLIHSMNPGKAPIMVRRLEEAGFGVTRTSWFDINDALYHEWLEEVREAWEDRDA
ncbi:cyclic-phosphate processing receiver domain-containing protein [uncultured Desulfobulbus sp.]|uniref:cyclic-phosphate processing receiver domain-containing protein n=1 Tax=uncultured Desulfobulbus sp. TaxID=239745 RepID=UPI0029C90CE3|nr:cyclic-phosphate processing receiver domain-containing protein [uncultured Desulfobulbus sp.]